MLAHFSSTWLLTVLQFRGGRGFNKGSTKRVFVTCLLCLQLFQQSAIGALAFSSIGAQAQLEAASDALTEYEEVVELRTENSKTYTKQTADGTLYRLEQSGAPIHFIDTDKRWQEISTDIQRLPDGSFFNRTNSFKSEFSASTLSTSHARITFNDYSLALTVPAAQPSFARLVQVREAGSAVEYPNVLPGIDARFSIQSNRLTKEFVLQNPAAVREELPFLLHLSEGVSAELVDGQIVLKKNSLPVAELPRPKLYELDNRNRGYVFAGEVSFSLEHISDHVVKVTKILSPEAQQWLRQPERQYPVAVDATLNLQVGAGDDDGDSQVSVDIDNSITRDRIPLGNYNGNSHIGAARFSSVALAQGTTITSAELILTALGTYDCGACTLSITLQLDDVDDSAALTTTNINDRTGTTASSNHSITATVDNTEYNFAITSQVQEVLDRGGFVSGNAMTVLASDNGSDSSEWQEYYTYNNDPAKAPKLVIVYSGGGVTYTQEGYRWRDDDGSETTASWLASQDSNITRATAVTTRLRTLVDTSGDAPTNQYQLEYKLSSDTGYQKVGPAPSTATPVVQSRSSGASAAANTTSHVITMPSGITAGDLLLIVFSSDGQPDIQINTGGWIRLGQARNSTVASGALFYKFAEGSDTATVTTSASEQSSHVVLRISGAGIPMATSSNGSGTNSNPPSIDMGTSRNHLWVATRSGDSTVVASVAPTSYTDLQTQAAAGTGGASTNTAEYSTTSATEDPGTFTSASEQWASFTIGIPPADATGGLRFNTAQATGTTSLSVAYPPSISPGDLLVLAIANKHSPNVPSTPSGWTAPSNNQATGTSGTDGVDTGSVYTTVFTKIADGTESGNLSVTVTSGNSSTGRIFQLRAASGKVWSTALASGNDQTPGTGWSVTAGSDPGITAGDIVLTVSGMNSDAYAWSAQSISATSVTFSNHEELSELNATNGNDVEMTVSAHFATSGTSSAAPVFSMTSSGSATNAPVGATVFVRARQVDAPIILSASSNITASGDNTTAQLTAPSGKSTSDFDAGRMQDDENPADTVDISTDDYTELEWSLQATNTATASEVYQFRVTIAGTALDTYSVTPQWTIGSADSTFVLSSYRWYVDNDSENVASVWGNPDLAEDTALALLPATNAAPIDTDELRLRTAITIATNDLAATSKQFKLQYKAGTDGVCTTGSWTDVGAGGGGEIWRYATSSVSDGTTLTALKLTISDVLGVYGKASPTATNPNAATIGQAIEYDFHLQNNGASTASLYSFRVVESDGTVFATYDECPTLSTRQVVEQELRHGDVFGNEVERGFTRVD